METKSFYLQVHENQPPLRISVVPVPEDYRDVTCILDASVSMGHHFKTLLEVGQTALQAGASVVFFSNAAKAYTPFDIVEEKDCCSWDGLMDSDAWNAFTHYEEGLQFGSELIQPDSAVLFMTDGAPNGKSYNDVLSRVHETLQPDGFMQSLYLGDPKASQMVILNELCTDGVTPLVTSSTTFKKDLRSFLHHTICVHETTTSVRVGAYLVEETAKDTDEDHKNLLTDIKDIPFMHGAVAAVLKFLQRKKTNAGGGYIYAAVHQLNKWMAIAGDNTGIQKLIQAGRQVAAQCGTQGLDTSSVVNILNAAKVMVLQENKGTELDIMVDMAMNCMANNPPKWVRKAYIARTKLQAKFKHFLHLQSNIMKTHGHQLLKSFPMRCVEIHVDQGLLEEVAELKAGKTTDVVRATMATQNPCAIDVHFANEWVAASLEEHRDRPSLMMPEESELSGSCVQLATSSVLNMSTHLAPWMLINGIWNLPLENKSSWPLARSIVQQLRAYGNQVFYKNKPNPFDFFPNNRPYPYGYSFNEDILQVPSAKAALMAALFCTESQHTSDPEFWVRSFMPTLYACKSAWPDICDEVSQIAYLGFDCEPDVMMKELADGKILTKCVLGHAKPVVVDLHCLDMKRCEAEMRAVVIQSSIYAAKSFDGLAYPYPTWQQMENMYNFITNDRFHILPVKIMIEAVSRFAFIRQLHGGLAFSQRELDEVLVECQFQKTNRGFQFQLPSRMTAFVKSTVTRFILKAHLPKEMGALLNVAASIDIRDEIHHVILGIDKKTVLTCKECTTLLSYADDEKERGVIWSATTHEAFTPVIMQSWNGEWRKEFLQFVQLPLLCKSSEYIRSVGSCLDLLNAPCDIATKFLTILCQFSMDTVVDLISGLTNHVLFSTQDLGSKLQFIAESALNHPKFFQFLDRCVTVPHFCESLSEAYVEVLNCKVKPTKAQQLMAASIRVYCPIVMQNKESALATLIKGVYATIPVCPIVANISTNWMRSIREQHKTINLQTAYKYVSRPNNSLLSGHIWIRKQLRSSSTLKDFICLRKIVAKDGGSNMGPRMQMHNMALEVLYLCILENTTTIPQNYTPIEFNNCEEDDIVHC